MRAYGDPGPAPEPPVRALRWTGHGAAGRLEILDQTRLPTQEVRNERSTAAEVVADIRRLAVRGAPAIGVAGAYAVALAAREAAAQTDDPRLLLAALERRAAAIASARPTAVNLSLAVRAQLEVARSGDPRPGPLVERLLEAAHAWAHHERLTCAAIGRAGADWLGVRRRFLTHCNAGSLATTGIGTALAPVYVLAASGASPYVLVDETRPLLQGLRLTAYELRCADVDHDVIADSAAPGLLLAGRVEAVLVGADRIARNGDVLNKVGTLSVALAAREAGVPFLVFAPLTTLDPDLPAGSAATIEDRSEDLGLYLEPGLASGERPRLGPAFDLTPARLVTALVSEEGVIERPDEAGLRPWIPLAGRVQGRRGTGR